MKVYTENLGSPVSLTFSLRFEKEVKEIGRSASFTLGFYSFSQAGKLHERGVQG